MWSSLRNAVTLLLAVHLRFATPNVIGIDFGSENMKIGIVSPGTPLDIGMHPVFYVSIYALLLYSIVYTLKCSDKFSVQEKDSDLHHLLPR